MIIFAADFFVEHYRGGAELTTEAIYEASLIPAPKVVTQLVTPDIMEKNKHYLWVFGNFHNLSDQSLLYAIKNLKYVVMEYDYKYCSFRSPEKHVEMQGKCDCHDSKRGKLVSMFLNSSVMTWWMSHNQKNRYQEVFPFLSDKNNRVLNSVLSEETLEYIESLDTTNKVDKWIIMNSESWIKGVDDAVNYAKENNLEYELLWGLEHEEFLWKLAESKGLIFLPKAGDTCPRMVVEAKLLDCELVLNDNVQHKDEEWFATRDSTLEYLRSRTDVFWNTLEDLAWEQVGIPESEVDSETRYHIVVPFYNAEKWIRRNIDSIKRQRHKNFICTLIDDVSDDSSNKIVKDIIENDERFQLITNQEKRYALGNIVCALERTECRLDDVVVLLDGDDWFASSKTLSRVSEAYIDGECLLTYGSYMYFPMGTRGVEPSEYSMDVINNNTFRQDKWRASHLRTFKHELWKNLNHDDLKDDEGAYFKMTYDQAIMLPLLEMAGERAKYIPEILHIYNKDNPLNIDKNKAQEQYALAQKIRAKKPYTRL